MRLVLLPFLATLVLDQISKLWVVFGLDLAVQKEIAVWPGVLTFRMAWNRGINFGLFGAESDAGRWILIGAALAICAGVLVWIRHETDWRVPVSAGLLVGGAIGNVVDRIAYGAVADFLNVTCCGIRNPWSFNVADAAIFAGALGLVLWAGRAQKA
jgi:signal peptidase II